MRSRVFKICGLCTLVLLVYLPAAAQTSAPAPLMIGDFAASGSLRTRVESWDWFSGMANNQYTYPGSILRVGLSESRKSRSTGSSSSLSRSSWGFRTTPSRRAHWDSLASVPVISSDPGRRAVFTKWTVGENSTQCVLWRADWPGAGKAQ